MKKILFLALVLLSTLCIDLNAQNTTDLLYLKNGSIIKGEIVEVIPDESIKIETAAGTFVYKIDEVLKTEKTAVEKNRQKKNFNKPKGYFGHASLSLPYFTTGINIINGYRFCPQFAMGVGIGFETYGYYFIGIPIYLHLRSDFLNNHVSPYLSVDVGVKLGASVYTSPQVGVSYNVGKFRMTTGIEIPILFGIGIFPAIAIGFSF